MSNLVVGMTGASGAAYAVRLVEVLLMAGRQVHLVVSPAGRAVLKQELDVNLVGNDFGLADLLPTTPDVVTAYGGWGRETGSANDHPGRLIVHGLNDYSAGIASGSFPTGGMVVAPCSMDTLGSLAAGLSGNLIHRAATVHLKERRPLILIPRETPLSTIHLENMARLSSAGAVVLPAMPGLYHHPRTLLDAVDFIVARACDQLGIDRNLMRRWGTESEPVRIRAEE